jgi:hypothetical protein
MGQTNPFQKVDDAHEASALHGLLPAAWPYLILEVVLKLAYVLICWLHFTEFTLRL